METICLLTQFLLLCFASFLLTCESSLIRVPQNHRAAGVFMLIEGERYTLNFTAAAAACTVLNATIATRAQMERAVQRGLETCKFGWIYEKIVVVPRLQSDPNCGQGKIGVVPWSVRESRTFGVFCFSASDLEEKTSTARLKAFMSSTTLTARTQTLTPTKSLIPSTSTSPSSIASKAPEQPSFTSPMGLLVKTTLTARRSPTSPSPQTLSTQSPTSRPLITSEPTVVTFTISAAAHDLNFSVSSESVLPPSLNSTKPSLGAIFTGIIVLGVILLLLTAAGAVWYYRQNVLSWSHLEHRDDVETEMWKHTGSEMDLHSQPEEEEEEEESDRKYSSEIRLCVNPNITSNSSQ